MMNYETSKFLSDLKEMNLILSKKQLDQFLLYFELLTEWNRVMNLTAITEYDEVISKHFVDSLSLIKAYDLSKAIHIIDVGTGAGFPGMPLKIAFPHLQITLLDSLNKRINFLNCVIETLGLTGIQAVHGRAEDFAKPSHFREKYDLCVSRAVANMTTLSEYCLPFVKVGGQFISYKSEKLTEELESAQNAIHLLGGQVKDQIEFVLPGSDIYRNLLVIEKIRETPRKYPRKAGLPAKEPLK